MEIYFDDSLTSDSGKHMPIELATDQPHNCPESLYNKRKTKYRN